MTQFYVALNNILTKCFKDIKVIGAESTHQRKRPSSRHKRGNRYLVLADYMALTSREIDLTEDETVELIKVSG
jgi:hypothetical protein